MQGGDTEQIRTDLFGIAGGDVAPCRIRSEETDPGVGAKKNLVRDFFFGGDGATSPISPDNYRTDAVERHGRKVGRSALAEQGTTEQRLPTLSSAVRTFCHWERLSVHWELALFDAKSKEPTTFGSKERPLTNGLKSRKRIFNILETRCRKQVIRHCMIRMTCIPHLLCLKSTLEYIMENM